MLSILVVSIALLTAPSAPKPACSAAIRGQFWPPEANRDPKLANRLAREGLLEICTQPYMRYRWKALSVHFRQLKGRR